MPIYEYGCEKGHLFEVKQKLTDAPVMTCRVCDRPVTKLVSAPAIMFKGSGWYITDYSDKMKGPAPEGTSKDTPAPAPDAKKDGTEKPTPPPPSPPGAPDTNPGGSQSGPTSASSTPSGS